MSAHFSEKISIDVLHTFARQFSTGLLRLATTVAVARILGPAGAGAYALTLMLPAILAHALSLGLASANVYFIASRRYTLETVWAASRNAAILLSGAGLVGSALLVGAFGQVIFPGVPKDLLYIGLMTLPCLMLLGTLASLFQAIEDFRAFNVLNLSEPLISLVLILFISLAGQATLQNILAVTIAAHIASTLVAMAIASQRIQLFVRGRGKLEYIMSSLRYGLVSYSSNVITYLNYRLDLFLVNLILGPSIAGVYAVAVRLAEQLWIVSQAVSTVIFPRLSALHTGPESPHELLAVASRMTLWITAAASLIFAAFALPVIVVGFGHTFAPAAGVLVTLLPGVALLSCSRVLANDLAARGLVRINLAFAAGALVLNAVGNAFLIPRHGALGAAAVTSFTYSLDLLIRLAIQGRTYGANWWTLIASPRSDLSLVRNLVMQFKWRHRT